MSALKKLFDPKYTQTLIQKIRLRLMDKKAGISMDEYRHWLDQRGVTFEQWGREKDPALYEESIARTQEIYASADRKLKDVPFFMGGGALCPILYFLVRWQQPHTLIETGVAAGYSSETIFQALKKNGSGKLFSSDFPYFRQENPEQYIGIIVSDEFRKDWPLYIEGDAHNLKKIYQAAPRFDFFHYDSDKRYAAREKTLDEALSHANPGAVIMVDDIHDNPHFHDFVTKHQLTNYVVFRHKGTCVAAAIFLDK